MRIESLDSRIKSCIYNTQENRTSKDLWDEINRSFLNYNKVSKRLQLKETFANTKKYVYFQSQNIATS